LSKEDPVVKIVLEDLLARYRENIIAIYGIGSFFDEEIPGSWEKKDIDIIVIVKSLDPFPKADWTEVKFLRRKIEGMDVWVGFNTLEGYNSEKIFKLQSFSNYTWSILDIKFPKNSVLLHGQDIRDQLPNINDLVFDFDDILARGLYHLDKSFREKNIDKAKREFSKGVFKTSFLFCIMLDKGFTDTKILRIGQKLKETGKIIIDLDHITKYFEEAIVFRTTGYYITEFKRLRENFISYIFVLLESGKLHRKMSSPDLEKYLSLSFGGFSNLLQFLHKTYKRELLQQSPMGEINGDINLQSINLIGAVKEKGSRHSFERADGTKGSFASFILEDQTGIIRVVIWNDKVRKRLFQDVNFTKNSIVEIRNGYIRSGYKEKIELHIGKYGDVFVHNIFSPNRRIKRDISKSKVITQLNMLNINDTKVSRTPCHFCGLLCSPSAKKCPKCGELLITKL
jgi:hypothetical protein